ncbi:MAG TPA: GNAT family N-acetyltransferase [Hyphomonadaceae bacterium]|nr:GNAT family N-acetyltransferase [Hyphomonadaceae bacterium]
MTIAPTLATTRLWLKPLAMSDAPAIQRRFARWEVVKLLNGRVPWPYPADGAEQFLRKKFEEEAAGSPNYTWGVWLKDGQPDDPKELIGIIELRPKGGTDSRGFWLSEDFWGRGLMTEAADRVLDFAFDEVGMPDITLTNAKENIRSGAVKIRQGATPIGEDTVQTVSGEKPRQLWRITAEEWRARRAQAATSDGPAVTKSV